MSEFKHLNLYERQRIERYLKEGRSRRYIAAKLGRSVSSISDEILGNKVSGIYDAKKADHKAYLKRWRSKRDCMKVAMDSELQKFVVKSMKKEDQSPEGISGRLKNVETGIQYASTKAIYKFVMSPAGRQVERHLYSRAVAKKPGRKRDMPISIDGRVMIDKRPLDIQERLEFGHFEGDFIESGRDGFGSLLVIVERKTRYPFLMYLEDRSTASVNRAVEVLLKDCKVESLTIDNDISFQKHKELSELIQATIFFCHPQSPNEKGTVENRNKAIRRYVKKGSDLSLYPEGHFLEVERKLRDRFMKCLGYRTPREMWTKEIEAQKIPLSRVSGMISPVLKV